MAVALVCGIKFVSKTDTVIHLPSTTNLIANKEMSMSELEKWQMVNHAGSIEKLMSVLKAIGPVEISGGRGAYDMEERLRAVINGEATVNALTRNYGIRQQYIYLTA